MARVARWFHDKRVLGLIRRYLEAGVMDAVWDELLAKKHRRGLDT
jgi:hypothetical protein